MKCSFCFCKFLLFCFTISAEKVVRKPGDTWLIRGPIEYVPPVEVIVKDKRYLTLFVILKPTVWLLILAGVVSCEMISVHLL